MKVFMSLKNLFFMVLFYLSGFCIGILYQSNQNLKEELNWCKKPIEQSEGYIVRCIDEDVVEVQDLYSQQTYCFIKYNQIGDLIWEKEWD